MSPKDVLRLGLDSAQRIVDMYISDLDDADLLVRPVPGMNHIAWQVGHLIAAERHFAELVRPGGSPALPEGFAEAHSKEAAGCDDPAKFSSLAKYQELWKAQRAATLAALEAVPESDLDRADPDRFPPYAPTVAALLALCGTHALMHSGQFVAVRRKLGKPVMM